MGPALSAGLKSLRQEASKEFQALPWPAKTDEEWRRTDPVPFQMEEPAASATADIQVGYEPVAPELIQAGVIVTDIQTALNRFPDLTEHCMLQSGKPDGLKKFAALHQASWTQGLFVYVPEGVKIPLPLKTWIQAEGAKSFFPHALIVLEAGAEATLIDERRSGNSSQTVIANELTEIVLKEGASLRYLRIQRWNNSTAELFMQKATLEKDARFLNAAITLGGSVTKAHLETLLQGTGAHADLLGVLFGSHKQHFDFHTVQDHKAERTHSDLLYKSALKDEAKSVYTGLIRIEKSAQKSDAYQANRNLLLSDGASADSVPMLEILADDVRCTHGVAVGPVDEEQLFYLMSRGLAPADAERLIVQGFFEQVLQRVPLGEMNEQLIEELTNRLVAS
jgi:Fe-S cluster assembly protein SufD